MLADLVLQEFSDHENANIMSCLDSLYAFFLMDRFRLSANCPVYFDIANSILLFDRLYFVFHCDLSFID